MPAPTNPQVTLSVNGRFHAFEFAAALQNEEALHQLITPYPRWFLRRWKLDGPNITALSRIEFFRRAREKISSVIPLPNGQFLFNDWFDRAAALKMKEGADFFIGWSGNSERSLNRAKQFGQKTILERHSAHIEVQQELLKSEYARFGLKFVGTHPQMIDKEKAEYAAANWISLPSRFALNSFVQKGFSSSRLLHHPLAADLNFFRPQNNKSKKFTILFAGNLSLQKGVAYLLDAFTKWKEADAELHLVGSVSPEMKPLLSLWSDSRITYHGPKKGLDFVNALSRASVVCLPSIHDGFNQVALQAMASGSPVICSANTGSEELIQPGHNGFVVGAKSSEALVEKFEWAFKNQDILQVMGANARTTVEKSLSWSDYARRRLEELSRLLNCAEKLPVSL